MRPRKSKIDINLRQTGLNNAFAAIDAGKIEVSHTPPGSAPEMPRQIWKMGRVVLRRETAHRGGKIVIVVHDFATHLPLPVIERIAKTLRIACGCGGAVKGRTIELQGDQPGKVRTLLEAEGFEVAGVR